MNALDAWRTFLESIPLDDFRNKIKQVKWVEQDLPREIRPQDSIYDHYWARRSLLSFDEWFEVFWASLQDDPAKHDALRKFKQYYFDNADEEWFKLGFEARMYRTWVSVLTQLDLCYALEMQMHLMGLDCPIECSADLDFRGIDFQVHGLKFQVAKVSQRKEARTAGKKKDVFLIPYPVLQLSDMEKKAASPSVKPYNQERYKKTIAAFTKFFVVLPNGFVCFSPVYARRIAESLGSPATMEQSLKAIAAEIFPA